MPLAPRKERNRPLEKGQRLELKEVRATVPMIAVRHFSPGHGMISLWEKFHQSRPAAMHSIKMNLAMQDVTVAVPALDLRHAKALAGAGRLTLHSLAELDDEELAALGFDEAAVEAVAAWREKVAAKDAKSGPDDFTAIADVGKATAGKLKIHGVLTFSALEAQTKDMLADAGLSSAAVVAVQAWQDGRRGDG